MRTLSILIFFLTTKERKTLAELLVTLKENYFNIVLPTNIFSY